MVKQYDMVRVVQICNNRFAESSPRYQRHPLVGDVGTVLEVYSEPAGFEIECCAAGDGHTTWLEAMLPDEIEIISEKTPN